jgi:hypothetical protein
MTLARERVSVLLINSQRVYNKHMIPTNRSVSHQAKNFHTFLCQLAPNLAEDYNRVLLECQGCEVQRTETSYQNLTHVKAVGDIVVRAVNDTAIKDNAGNLDIKITSMNTAQSSSYRTALSDLRGQGRLPHEQGVRIRVGTVGTFHGDSADLVIVDFVRNDDPGFAANKGRVSVATTRARYGEIIVMSRGIFIHCSRERHSKSDSDEDWRLLAKLCQDVAEHGGVVTTKRGGKARPKRGGTKVCRNCNKRRHQERDCPQPLRCLNCDALGHSANICSKPVVVRCQHCGSEDHKNKDCTKIICYSCHEEGYKAKECTKKTPATPGDVQEPALVVGEERTDASG